MEERRRHADVVLEKVEAKLDHIEKLLKGNGVVGVAEMARRAFEHCQDLKRSKNGLYDWGYRILIGMMLSYLIVDKFGK